MNVDDMTEADLRAEVARLRRWKAEATEVTLGLQYLGRALGLPLGEQITGASATEAAQRLRHSVERVEALAQNAEELHAPLPLPHGPFTNGYRTALRDVLTALDGGEVVEVPEPRTTDGLLDDDAFDPEAQAEQRREASRQ